VRDAAAGESVKPALDYGLRLTDEEYERRIVELHRGLPPIPTKAEDEAVRRQELELAIDHRLGRDFPRARREELWAARQRIERRRLRFAVRHLLRRLFGKPLVRDAQHLAGDVADEYAKVLSGPELEQFLGVPEGERPALPVDADQREKRR
jgi:hypothetical protein